MISIIPADEKQAIRIKRFLMAFASYLFFFLLVYYCQYSQLLRGSLPFLIVNFLLNLFVNSMLYTVFRTGFNKRCKDPSLTLVQMVIAICWLMIFLYFLKEVRGVLSVLIYVIFVFGLFRLRFKQFLFLSFFSITIYGFVILVLYLQLPDTLDLKVEILSWIVLIFVLPWFSIVGGYMTRLRIQVKKALETIEKLAIHDELTQAFNRRHIYEILRYQKNLCDRGGQSFSVCILDLDHFKKVNDTFGHQKGDIVLQTVSQEIQNNLREIDTMGRYGGEEFLIILTGADEQDAKNIGERIRKRIETLSYEDLPSNYRVTVSIGISNYVPNETIENVIHFADTALYKAKSKGRNRIEFISLKPTHHNLG